LKPFVLEYPLSSQTDQSTPQKYGPPLDPDYGFQKATIVLKVQVERSAQQTCLSSGADATLDVQKGRRLQHNEQPTGRIASMS
jgi:hypothetical protein